MEIPRGFFCGQKKKISVFVLDLSPPLIPNFVDNPVEKWITFREKTLILHKKTLNLQQNYSYITIRKKHLPKSTPPDNISHAK